MEIIISSFLDWSKMKSNYSYVTNTPELQCFSIHRSPLRYFLVKTKILLYFSQYKFSRSSKPAVEYSVISMEVHTPWETVKEVVPPNKFTDSVFHEVDCIKKKYGVQVAHRSSSRNLPDKFRAGFDGIIQARVETFL